MQPKRTMITVNELVFIAVLNEEIVEVEAVSEGSEVHFIIYIDKQLTRDWAGVTCTLVGISCPRTILATAAA